MSETHSRGLSPAWVTAASALFIFFWASGFVAAKYGLPYAEPFTFLMLRFLLVLVVMVPAALYLRVQWPVGPVLIGHVIVVGLTVQTAYLIGVFYAIYLGISTGVIALIVGLQPLITGTLSAPVLGERVTLRQWIGLTLGFVGLGMVVAEKVDLSTVQAWGAALGLMALAGITAGTLYQKKFCTHVDIRAAVVIQNIGSVIVAGLLAVSMETMKIDWTGEFVFALLWSAMVMSVIALPLFYMLVRRGAAAKVTSLMYLSPPTTALMGWLMFDEILGAVAIAGMTIAVMGVASVNR